MGYTVFLQYEDLRCRSLQDARAAAAIVAANHEMCSYHLDVRPATRLETDPNPAPCLELTHFQGDHWHDDEAQRLWLALAPHMADGASLELEGEEGERWRIRWQEGRIYEEYMKEVIWAVERELQPPQGAAP
jgi:hypothetical protein